MSKDAIAKMLKDNGMRVTASRVAVVAFMEEQKHPVGIELLKKHFSEINEVTLYRMAADFVEKGIWNAVDLGHGHADYESASKPHHHHAVCESCGTIEEIYGCENTCQLAASVGSQAKQFKTLKAPTVAMFGTCLSCAK